MLFPSSYTRAKVAYVPPFRYSLAISGLEKHLLVKQAASDVRESKPRLSSANLSFIYIKQTRDSMILMRPD